MSEPVVAANEMQCPKAHMDDWPHGPVEEAHPCPFQSDVHNDDKYECTCCERCTQECADDI